MKKKDFFLLIEDVMEMESGSFQESVKLDDLKVWDSLSVISFMGLVHEHLGILLNPNDMYAAKTVSDLVVLLESKFEN